jgi:hypothetical protein
MYSIGVHQCPFATFYCCSLALLCYVLFDAPPNSLIDSTASPKVEIAKGERVGIYFLTHNTLGVEGHVGALG